MGDDGVRDVVVELLRALEGADLQEVVADLGPADLDRVLHGLTLVAEGVTRAAARAGEDDLGVELHEPARRELPAGLVIELHDDDMPGAGTGIRRAAAGEDNG